MERFILIRNQNDLNLVKNMCECNINFEYLEGFILKQSVLMYVHMRSSDNKIIKYEGWDWADVNCKFYKDQYILSNSATKLLNL